MKNLKLKKAVLISLVCFSAFCYCFIQFNSPTELESTVNSPENIEESSSLEDDLSEGEVRLPDIRLIQKVVELSRKAM